ncbi:hypothetical protein E2542_SST09620 [Spatholobus suberectus]|nr:hypothetical protein E2542_SST09620 [Spatholobus suberectus]
MGWTSRKGKRCGHCSVLTTMDDGGNIPEVVPTKWKEARWSVKAMSPEHMAKIWVGGGTGWGFVERGSRVNLLK